MLLFHQENPGTKHKSQCYYFGREKEATVVVSFQGCGSFFGGNYVSDINNLGFFFSIMIRLKEEREIKVVVSSSSPIEGRTSHFMSYPRARVIT